MRKMLLAALLLSAPLVPILAAAQNEPQQPAAETLLLGQVNFPISCTPAAQQQFNRAVATLHSF
jgi:hypothetical protein